MPRHKVNLGLGANLGERQANILQALQYLQTRATITKVSSFYETEPVGYLDQPNFLNAACTLETELSPHDLLHLIKWIEKRMGRQASFRNAPRPIDIDILLYDDLVLDTPDLCIPHPRLHERAFVLAPLAEIAPHVLHPILRMTVEQMLSHVGWEGVQRVERGLKFRLDHDVQKDKPMVPVSLSRVGVTNLRRIIQLENNSRGTLFYAELALFADLDRSHAGVHMSRFSDVLEDIVEEITLDISPNIESLAERLARQVVQSQHAVHSEVHIRVQYPMMRTAPVSGKQAEELYTLIGIAACNKETIRHVVGVEVNGLTVCPCAQDMVRSYSHELLLEDGFSEEQAQRILDLLPIASHNQRGRGTLLIGSEQLMRAEHLVNIVEASMSSETYELLKRPDEFFVVNKAHRNPRFVEDVVRELLYNLLEVYPDLPDVAFVLAKQENLESIHQHNAFAERFGTLGELRREVMGGEPILHHTTLEEWLRG